MREPRVRELTEPAMCAYPHPHSDPCGRPADFLVDHRPLCADHHRVNEEMRTWNARLKRDGLRTLQPRSLTSQEAKTRRASGRRTARRDR